MTFSGAAVKLSSAFRRERPIVVDVGVLKILRSRARSVVLRLFLVALGDWSVLAIEISIFAINFQNLDVHVKLLRDFLFRAGFHQMQGMPPILQQKTYLRAIRNESKCV